MSSNCTGKGLKCRTPTLTWELTLTTMETFVQQKKNCMNMHKTVACSLHKNKKTQVFLSIYN